MTRVPPLKQRAGTPRAWFPRSIDLFAAIVMASNLTGTSPQLGRFIKIKIKTMLMEITEMLSAL